MTTGRGVRVIVREPVRGWDADEEEEDDAPAPAAPQVIVVPLDQPAADREAFVRYIHDHWGDFIRAKLREERGLSDKSREDLAQRVLFVVNRCLHHQPAPDHPAAWLGEITDLEVKNHRKRWHPDVEPDADADAVIASGLSPESAALLAEQMRRLERYLRRLTPEEAKIVKMKELSGMTFEAIAEALGGSRATVARYHERAIEKLREMALSSDRGVG